LLSTCFQASLMREEERPVRFRLILREPGHFTSGQAPPEGINRVVFTEPRPCTEDELRRLSPAVGFDRSLIGVNLDATGVLQIWGLVHSGTRWLQVVAGGARHFSPLPDSLIIFVTGPGRISVSVGSEMVAALRGGLMLCSMEEVFGATWLWELFASHRAVLWEIHQEARQRYGERWAPLDETFPGILMQNVMRRVISLIRGNRHGGTLIVVPTEQTEELKGPNPFLSIKYTLQVDEARQRFHPLIARIMNEFARIAGEFLPPGQTAGWAEYVASADPDLSLLDEMLFELAHFVAELALVDGAVVMNRRFEVLGFGAEIFGGLDNIDIVRRALDVEGNRGEQEAVKMAGTRHRSAYRLCNALREALAVVVSQDGSVRFVAWKEGMVTCWDQVATSILDL
jgi:hypothetical protein